ncbi:ATP-binding protein [Streptomyces sp. SID8352]|uniref:ATP-binding protein n=1 Tax=Streptomyces sp. SID8352 TaxID=2690338 RepID=UPI001369299E|nr:ATP-binding protein [Streptomyces sp. SID8352]MYU22707.1 ATP-binding protein [Streptomyces sp. SID8352]
MNQHFSTLTLDHAGLGLPPGRYALPSEAAARFHAQTAGLDPEPFAAHLLEHYTGKRPVTELTEAERRFLRGELQEQVDEWRQAALDYFDAHVPLRFAKAAPDAVARNWAGRVAAAPHDTRSLLLAGPVGVGKTHYAFSALRAVAETGSTVRWQAYTAANLYAALRPRDDRRADADYESIAHAPLLFLDDLGAAKHTEWAEEVTYRLVNDRYERCLPTIFTTNVVPGQLGAAVGDRVASRIAEMCERVTLKGADRRKKVAA